MQKLPIGEQFFDRLREKNFVYVDKTEQIYALIVNFSVVYGSRTNWTGNLHRSFSLILIMSATEHSRLRRAYRIIWIRLPVNIL